MGYKLQDEEVWLRCVEQMAGHKASGRAHDGYGGSIALTRSEMLEVCETADDLLHEFKSRFRKRDHLEEGDDD